MTIFLKSGFVTEHHGHGEMRPLTCALRRWALASHITKKATSSAILRSTQRIVGPSAVSRSSRPQIHTLSHSASQSVSTLQLNNDLVNLVKHAQYDEAYRLRNHLFENTIHINHHLIYEKAALAGVELGKTGEGLEKFIIWLSLVPDRNELPTSLTTQRRYIYSDTRFSLLRCGNPKAYLKYIMVFGNIMATKGYIVVSFLEIARLVVRFGRKELVADYFKELEEATAYYYWEQEPAEGGWVLRWFWEVVIKLYVEKGWLDLAFEAVVEKGAKFGLSVELYKVLLKKLEECRDGERASVIQDLWTRQNKEAAI